MQEIVKPLDLFIFITSFKKKSKFCVGTSLPTKFATVVFQGVWDRRASKLASHPRAMGVPTKLPVPRAPQNSRILV